MKSRFKVLSLMSVFLLLFGGVAIAQNATEVLVEVSYPCDDEPCDTGEAVSRAINGDDVNIYITLLDNTGTPATAGPAGESLNTLTATVSTTLGEIEPNEFAADAQTVSFGGDATARANINYTDATPGIDQVIVSVSSDPDPLVGNAEVNVVAPPAIRLVARTLRSATPPQNIYDAIPDQANNGDADEPAGFSVPVTVIADAGGNLYTPDPALEGQTVTVKAYADYSADGEAGGGVPGADIAAGYEEDPIGEATFSFTNGIATGTVQINSAGPDGLDVVFTAEVDLGDDVIISTTLMGDPGVGLDDETVDTVTTNPLSADALLIGSDPYANGNLVMEEECIAVLDDNTTAEDVTVVLVDSLGNAVNAPDDVDVNGDLGDGSILDDQLTFSCDNDAIDAGDYSEGCSIQDTDILPAGSVVKGPLTVFDTDLGTDSVSIDLLPASGPGALDLDITSDQAGEQINAGDDVVLTLTADGDYLPVVNGDILEITATNLSTGAMQLLSSSDFASADTTLTVPANDADEDTPGLQIELKIYGPCSASDAEGDEAVEFTVTDTNRCDVGATSDTIADIEPGDPSVLAINDLADGVETESDLDDDGFVGTDPIVIDSPLIADGAESNPLLACDVEIRDEFDNVLEEGPELACTSSSGLGIVSVDTCDVDVVYVAAAVGTSDTISCEATDEDYAAVDPRNLSITNLISEEEEEVSEEATAIVIAQEGPQLVDGELIDPCGEGIVRISANGPLMASKNIEISFGPGTVAGAELRTLTSDTPLPIPFPVTLNNGDVRRYVVYAPTNGDVDVVAVDLGSEPLDPALLELGNCGPRSSGCANPQVAVNCVETELCDPETICTQCTAVTTSDGEECEDATYTWELNGTATTTNTGNSIEVCGEDLDEGTNTLTATDTTNGDSEGTATLSCGGITLPCSIDVVQETVLRSRWSPTVALITINGTDTEWVGGLLRDNFEITYSADVSRDLFWLPGTFPFLVEASQTIRQLIILLPAWFTSCCFDGSAETMTVEVCNTETGCCDEDTVEITMLPLFLEQQ